MNEIKPTITIKGSDYPGISLNVDDTGSITLNFKVVGVNKPSGYDLEPIDPEDVSYTLEYETTGLSKNKVSLKDAAERAATKEIRVVDRVQPAP